MNRPFQTLSGVWLRPALLPGLLAVLILASCGRQGETGEQLRVKLAFASCRNALINHQASQALAYISHDFDDYVNRLISGAGPSTPGSASSPAAENLPGVDLLLRTALDKKVPADLRPQLTLDALMQRITDKHLLNPREVQHLSLGRVTVNGNHASAELYYEGTLTALQLPFVKEGADWKIDVMAVLPYAEVLMRVDRAIKGETEARQVEQLVSKLPSL